jgi:O-antigen biosynthesis protein
VRISVIIPSHNVERYLAQSIGSALDQTLAPHEVIVVDDGSTDGSLRLARQFEARFRGQVRVFSESCLSAPRVRNRGAIVATGDALMFLDADDVLRPDALEALAEVLGPHPNAVAICPWFHLHLQNERWVQGPPTCTPRRPGQDPLTAYLSGWAHPPVSVLWSREGFELAGRWDERCSQNQDGDLMMRALVLGVPLVETKRGAGFYRRMPPGQNLTTVTGKRHTPHGVRNLIYVTRKVAWMAEQTGQVRRYRPALRRSFASISGLADKNGFTDLAKQARAGVLLYQQPWELFFSWRGQNQLRRAYRELRRRLAPAPSLVARDQHDEVRYGLEMAAQASLADPDAFPPSPAVDRPTVSVVVVAAADPAAAFQRTVDEVLQQLSDVEVLLVHPAGIEATCDANQFVDPRVRLLSSPTTRGLNAARNHGLRAARGEILALRDADDLRGLDALAEQVGRLQREPEDLGLVARDVDQQEPKRRGPRRRTSGRVGKNCDLVPTGVSGVVFRRSVIASIGFFDETRRGEDPAEYWSRVPRFFAVDLASEPHQGGSPDLGHRG